MQHSGRYLSPRRPFRSTFSGARSIHVKNAVNSRLDATFRRGCERHQVKANPCRSSSNFQLGRRKGGLGDTAKCFFFGRAADPLIIVCIRKRRNGPRRAPNGPVITGHNSTPTPPIRQEMARQIERNCTLSWFLEGGGLNGISNIGQPLTGQTPAEQVTRRCRDV